MVLSPADFYAYSRATGTPVPQDPEERAAVAPDVLEFRRNQLKSEPEGQNLLATLGIGALATAGAVALGLAGRRALRGPAKSVTSPLTTEDLSRYETGSTRRAAAQTPVPPSQPAPTVAQPGAPTEEERRQVYAAVASKPESELPRVYRPKGGHQEDVLVTDPNTGEMFRRGKSPASFAEQYISLRPELRGQKTDLPIDRTPGTFKEFSQNASSFSPRQYVESTGSLAPTDLTSVQESTAPLQRDQFINAVESGEDQQTGRVMQRLQSNEDLDLSQVELLEEMSERSRLKNMEQDAPINQAASQLPDGLPVDQAEGIKKTSAQLFLQRERDEIASQLGEQNLPITPSRIEQELANRLTKSAYEYGPKYSARRQGLELYAQTGNPVLLNRIQRFGMAPASFETFETMPAEKRIGFENAPPFSTAYYPSEELSSTGLSSNISINLPTRGQVSLAELRKPVITEDTAQRAEEFYQERKGQALDWLGNLRVQLEPKRNQILKERRLIVEQTVKDLQPQLEAARQSGNQELAAELEQNLNVLRTVWQNPRLGSHRENELRLLDAQIAGAQNKIAGNIAGIQKKYPTTITDWSGESARIFGELDTETGELIPESIEIRGDRPSRMMEPKGGGGRNIAEYTAGERLDEEIRAIQGGGRIRDYDPETGAVAQRWLGDNTQTGREIDIYGIRLSGEKRADPTKRPSEPQYTKQEIVDEAMRMSQSDPYGDVPVAPEYADVVESLGYQEPTPEAKRSVLMSEAIRKAALLREQRNPRGGVVPDELTILRRQIAQLDEQPELKATGRLRRVPGTSIPPQQLTLPGVTGYKARQTTSPADVAAEQLESYMSKLQRGRSTPITSAVRIQPSLF